MAYDKMLEQRIDALIVGWQEIEKIKMFGGVCYLLSGNICFGIWQDNLIVRTTPDTAGVQMQQEHVRAFDITGRPMKGWLLVACGGVDTDTSLSGWLNIGHGFARTLPEK